MARMSVLVSSGVFMVIRFFLAFCFSGVLMATNSPLLANTGEADSIIDMIPAIVAATLCQPGNNSCDTRSDCERRDGFWQNGQCIEKSQSFLNTEGMGGRWYLITDFPEGEFANYLVFNASSITPVAGTVDFYLQGAGHSNGLFNDIDPTDAVISYDSAQGDWFIFDYWGVDDGLISSIEVARISDSVFSGCEYFVDFPELTYVDGVCHPVRMTRQAMTKIGSSTQPPRQSLYSPQSSWSLKAVKPINSRVRTIK